MKRLQSSMIQKQKQNPLTLTLSPQGRGDKAVVYSQGRGDKVVVCSQGRGDKAVVSFQRIREGEAPAEPVRKEVRPLHLSAQQELRPPNLRRKRRGYSILEMIVAMILLGAVMSIVVPTLGWMGVENRLSQQRQEAIQGLHNLMEELTTRPYAELTPDTAGKIELPEALKNQLPGARLQVEIAESPPNAKRIQAKLSWNQRNGSRLAPVRLTAWVHEQEEQP